MQASGAGTGDLRFMIWDEELRVVVGQLDKNLSLLKVLYPVVMAVSVLIGAGLCFLLLLQATREAAILRVLGVTRRAVRLALIVEPLFLSVIGVIIGLGIPGLCGGQRVLCQSVLVDRRRPVPGRGFGGFGDRRHIGDE